MGKEISDKVKQEIADSQISAIQKDNTSAMINHDVLRGYLMNGLDSYIANNPEVNLPSPTKEGVLNEKVDFKFLRKMEKEQGTHLVVRVKNAVHMYSDIEYQEEFKNSHFLQFYNKAEETLIETGHFGRIRNYRDGSHQFLKKYLQEKGLIE